eukprot:Colp12_sorted_trinity150504_noHs@27562
MGCWKLGHIPKGMAFITLACFITTYSVALSRGDVPAFWPYISDTGAEPPESCIFSLCLYLASSLALLTVIVRYLHLSEYGHYYSEQVIKLNKIAFYLGCIACFGLVVVASFQEQYVLSVHLVGAFLTFAGGLAYEIVQTVISYKTQTSVALCRLRVALVTTCIAGFLCCILPLISLCHARLIDAVYVLAYDSFLDIL